MNMELGHRSYRAGIGYILAAWLLFTLMTFITRFASVRIPIATILLVQNFIGFFFVIPWICKHGWPLVRTNRFGLIFYRSITSLVAIALSFLAVQKISLVNTMLLGNTSPLWIPFVVLIWRKIPLNHSLWPGLIGGFIGILLILRPGQEILQIGALFALGAGVLQSINMVSLRVLSYTERNHTIMFYYFLICMILCLPLSIYQWVLPGILEWAEMIAIGILFALGQFAFVRSFHHAKASELGPFSYSAVVFSVLIEWALYGQTPDLIAWVGILLVSLGGIWAIRFSRPIN